MSKIKIAIDIGKFGGYSIFNKEKIINFGKIDTSSFTGLNLLSKLICDNGISEVIFEKPFGIAGNKNMNTFINYGRIQSVPMLLEVPFVEVLPKTWISMYRGIGSNKKKHSLKAIHLLYKSEVKFDEEFILKEDGVADAVLIANYYRIVNKY